MLKHDSPTQEAQLINQVGLYRRINHDKFLGSFPKSQIQIEGNVSWAVTNTPAWDDIEAHQLAELRYEVRGGTERFTVVDNKAATQGAPLIVKVKNGATPPGSSPLYDLVEIPGIIVHTKTVLIDDHWAVIGSANITRRSLYTDFEHSFAVLDEDDVVVRDYRMSLWDEQFDHHISSDFSNIDKSLYAWETTWGTPGAITSRTSLLEKVTLPLLVPPDPLVVAKALRHYNRWLDPDSRKTR